jgi:hypothetical protein
VFGVVQRSEPEQGVDRGETGVAGAGAVGAVVFEVVEERRDQRRVEVADVEAARGFSPCVARRPRVTGSVTNSSRNGF